MRSSESSSSGLCPLAFLLQDDGAIPNHPRLPLLLWRGVIDPHLSDPAAELEALFARNGWLPAWRNGIYAFPHYHSSAHEVLGIARGRARVRFGGARGVVLAVAAGDVLFIPAGVGHERLEASADLLVVGAYPKGHIPDLCSGRAEEREAARRNIAALPDPPDPLSGQPLARAWTAAGAAGDG